jgi:hypothetical protein
MHAVRCACAARQVLGSSPFLMSLANDSRAFLAGLAGSGGEQPSDARGLG